VPEKKCPKCKGVMSLQADQYVLHHEKSTGTEIQRKPLSLDVYICGSCGYSEFSLPASD
jgi:predicted nucleic-acid-binding Zn-ribbon protein